MLRSSSIMLLILSASTAAQATQMVGYKADYAMKLASPATQSPITEIEGRSVYTIMNDCEGWDSVEDYLLSFTYETGEELIIASHFASWEGLSGDLYSFEISEESNYEPDMDFNGFAQRDEDAAPTAVFSMQPDQVMPLPGDVLFPVTHTQEILKRARAGETTYFAHVFFGAEPDRAIKKASAIIGQKSKTQNMSHIDSSLIEIDVWPVQIAYFNPDDSSGIPDYELRLMLQDNGIVQSYSVNYGDFVLRADMLSLAPTDMPVCKG